MCGIAGMVAAEHADPALVESMAALLRHRGPDDEGFVAVGASGATPFAGQDTAASSFGGEVPFLPQTRDPGPGPWDVVLASRRLAIIDLSAKGHQPLSSPGQQAWIVHNGEIYNYLELRRELTALGHRFVGDSDTEVALAAYREWGTRCFERFNGMWGIAIWDVSERRLVLSRDRFGVKPLYYAKTARGLVFASELKALLASGAVAAEVNEAAIDDFVATGRIDVRGYETCFAHVRQVEPGTFVSLTLRNEALTAVRYYDLEATIRDAHTEHLGALLDDAVGLRLRSDVPVGSSLSGGVDSSAVVALAQRRLGVAARMQTFTFASGGDDDEGRYARLVADHVGADNVAVGVDEADLNALLDRILWEQEEPIGSGSVLAQRSVMEVAHRDGLKVLLDGQGGDEALGGYLYYVGAALADLLAGLHVGRAAATVVSAASVPGQRASWLVRAGLAGLRKQSGQLTRLQALQLDDVRRHLPALLHYEDRNSMAFSIETRLPFLDYRVVELGLRLANEVKIEKGVTKSVLRRAVDDVLPREIVWRRDKIQFSAPQDRWLDGPLRELLHDTVPADERANPALAWRRLAVARWRAVFARVGADAGPRKAAVAR